MARECGPPSLVLHARKIHAEARSRGGFLYSATPRLRALNFGIEPVSPGWPAFAGHDNFVPEFKPYEIRPSTLRTPSTMRAMSLSVAISAGASAIVSPETRMTMFSSAKARRIAS